MREKLLRDILGDFEPVVHPSPNSIKGGGPVTIWLPAQAKARYDRLQKSSGRGFSKKARQLILALIEMAESRMAG